MTAPLGPHLSCVFPSRSLTAVVKKESGERVRGRRLGMLMLLVLRWLQSAQFNNLTTYVFLSQKYLY